MRSTRCVLALPSFMDEPRLTRSRQDERIHPVRRIHRAAESAVHITAPLRFSVVAFILAAATAATASRCLAMIRRCSRATW